MANFIFNWASAALTANTLDLSTGDYYAHLVATVPALGHSIVTDLVLPAISGYTSTPLTGLSYNSARWTFDSFNFPIYNFASAPTGVVICKRIGATPATTDAIVCYSDFNNSIGQVINLRVGTYIVSIQFGVGGAISFNYKYQYNSAAYSPTGGAFPPGLIYLLGTKNNTQAYTNPFNITTALDGLAQTDRLPSATTNQRAALDFGSNLVRFGTVGINWTGANSNATTIWATNNLASWTAIDIDNNANWTQIGISASYSAGWNFINVSNNNYYRYFKLTRSSAVNQLNEIEFYSSSLLSTTLNMI